MTVPRVPSRFIIVFTFRKESQIVTKMVFILGIHIASITYIYQIVCVFLEYVLHTYLLYNCILKNIVITGSNRYAGAASGTLLTF